MKVKVKNPFIHTYKSGEIFFSFRTNFNFHTSDLKEISKGMRKKLIKLLNK